MNIGAILADGGYSELKQFILNHSGLSYYADKDEDFAARLSRRLSAREAASCRTYLSMLVDAVSGQAEVERLVGELTIGETYFFRQQEHFDLLREKLLPDLLERNAATRRLRIWSAGCATGAEPYSLAILLHREFEHRLVDWDVEILATDINVTFLAAAQEGSFADWALRETPEDLKACCFKRDGKRWTLRPEFKKRISFKYHNLVGERDPVIDSTPFDLILCRNVIIYFSRERTLSVIDRFRRVLKPGGWLLVGYAEASMEMFAGFETILSHGATAYRNPGGEAVVEAQPAWPVFDFPPTVAPVRPSPPASEPARSRPKLQPQDLRLLADQGSWKAAGEIAKRMIAADPLDPATHFTLGLIQEHEGDIDGARDSLHRAIYLDRGFVLAHYHMAACWESGGERKPARRSFQSVLDLLKDKPAMEPLPHGDGITAEELRELAVMHLELLSDE